VQPGSEARRLCGDARSVLEQTTTPLRACRDRGLKAEAGFEMLVQQVPEYLRFFGFDGLAQTLRTDLGAMRSLLYPE
jgi:shikimate dehydrogenase